jgi:hypothetical protein
MAATVIKDGWTTAQKLCVQAGALRHRSRHHKIMSKDAA